MSNFEHYFIARNGLWDECLQDVKKNGFDKSSPLGRLIYSCEIGDINQHASEDLKAISATLATLRDDKLKLEIAARDFLRAVDMQSEITPEEFTAAHDALAALVKGDE
jgi:hypothetical protein